MSPRRRNHRWRFGLVTSHVAIGASVHGSLTPQNLGKVALPGDAIAVSLIKPGSSVTKTSEIVPLSATFILPLCIQTCLCVAATCLVERVSGASGFFFI